jgi:hypothetical protein
LTNSEAIAFLASLAVLLAYAQTRVWNLARGGVRRLTRPIQLPDDSDPDSLTRISQKEAIISACSVLFNVCKTKSRRRSMATISPWFGVAAILNLVAFASLGAVIPWALTGRLQTPVVQSQRCHTDIPRAARWTDEQTAYIANDKYQKCWFDKTEGSDACAPENGILLDRPEMHVSRNITCPFHEAACSSETQPLQLEYINLTLRDVGLNVRSDLLLSRRLTCSPLNITHFLRNESDGSTWISLVNPASVVDEHDQLPYLRQRLSSHDGRRPSRFGMHWLEGRTPDLRYWGTSTDNAHPDLQRPDGDIFVLLYDAGRAVYTHPVDDPIYSAHQHPNGPYLPDFEYTAMGCLEQHRICLSSSGECMHCSFGWAPGPAGGLQRMFRCQPVGGECSERPGETIEDCEFLTTLGRIAPFVAARGVAAMLTFERNTWNNPYILVDPLDQWARDVKAWFEGSFLMMRQSLLLEFLGDPDPRFEALLLEVLGDPNSRFELPRVVKRCRRVLFLDSDYTNINFPGFLLTLVLVVGISGLSHATYVKEATGSLRNILVDAFRSLSRLCCKRVSLAMVNVMY